MAQNLFQNFSTVKLNKLDLSMENLDGDIDKPVDFYISFRNKRKKQWNTFIIFLAIINGILVPLNISFEPPFIQTNLFKIINAIIDIFFVIDCILQFYTSFQNKYGEEVKDRKKIAYNYIVRQRTRFLSDFLSVLGNNIFIWFWSGFQVFGIFKIFRINRLNKFLKTLNFPADQKSLIMSVKFFFYLVLILHINACYWHWSLHETEHDEKELNEPDHYKVISLTDSAHLKKWYETKWIPMTNALNFSDMQVLKNEWPWHKKYSFFLYYSIIFLGIGEIGPVGVNGTFNATIILIASFIVNNFILGEFV